MTSYTSWVLLKDGRTVLDSNIRQLEIDEGRSEWSLGGAYISYLGGNR